MTCVVGLLDEGKVWFGADSAGTDELMGQDLYNQPKVFRNGPYMIGCVGSPRMTQILQHCFVPPDPDEQNIDRFMATSFARSLRECFKDEGWLAKDSEREFGGSFIVAVSGKLFLVQPEFDAMEPQAGYLAVGSGAQVALGSLFSTEGFGLEPEDRVEIALAASQRFDASVREPFLIECFDPSVIEKEVTVKVIKRPGEDVEIQGLEAI